uniref:Uncharacterized protein n=1 Tax=Romanomermis culicivorax TaxID=13658 RepID=A0A915KH81_ROMCU
MKESEESVGAMVVLLLTCAAVLGGGICDTAGALAHMVSTMTGSWLKGGGACELTIAGAAEMSGT